MESFLDRTKDADLDQLIRELAARRHGNKRRSLRLQAWKFTVRGSFALKRTIDIVGSFVGMVLLSPVFLAIAIAVKLSSPGPVIFRQVRVGRYGRHFWFYKFRSMRQDAEAQKAVLMAKNESKDGVIFKMKDDPRITKVGRFIRKYSIDELPQLINILRGDMSIVGNRPLPLYEAEKLTADNSIDRFMAPAGLTGLWQVEERGKGGKMSAEERKQLDIEYGQTYSFALDMKIIFRTLFAFKQDENV
jgi:lipopolysaccharide/colanic/teichoic acid biosynthesis glycosyltransferase